jgi:hypothetical protein
MGETTIISALLGLAWLVVISLGIVMFAMADHIGSRYVYTSAGISRSGPPIGKQLSPIEFNNKGTKYFISDLISKQYPTLILFLATNADLTSRLIDNFIDFATIADHTMEFLIFCNPELRDIPRITRIGFINVFVLDNKQHNLLTNLGIRVTPFALLVDQNAVLLAKGLLNNFEHICLLIEAAREHSTFMIDSNLVSVCEHRLSEDQQN